MPEERTHAIDALRVFAMMSVVVLHASISYMTVRMPDLLWAVHDPGAVSFFDWLFFWIRGLTMRIFFLVAGFFAVMLYEKLGPRGFLENRRRRILIPFLVGVGILLPLSYLVWCYGWIQTGQCEISQVLRTKFSADIQRNLYGPGHLWFLEFLLIFYAIFYMVRKLRPSVPVNSRWISTLLFSPLRPFLLAIPSTLILWIDIRVVINFHNTFIPQPLKLLYYGLFFWVGVKLYVDRERLKSYTSHAWIYLLASLPFFVVMGELTKKHIVAPLHGLDHLSLAMSISVFAWLSVFAFMGLFIRYLNREQALIRYLSGASYWIFLCHFPVVGILQVFLHPFGWPAAVKFLIVLVTTFAFGLVSYEGIVRTSLIGACLNGSAKGVGPKPLAKKTKIGLSLTLVFLIALCGVSFQQFYNLESKRYENVITGFYQKYFNREPDAVGLRHWTNWALNRWGLEKVEEEGFVRVSERERE